MAFYVYDRLRPDHSPRRYTVVAGDALFDFCQTLDRQGRYELAVYGPNGWLCEFRGVAPGERAQPVVIISADAATETASLLLSNAGADACSLSIADAYDAAKAIVRRIEPGATLEERRRLSAHSGWYDLNLTATDLLIFCGVTRVIWNRGAPAPAIQVRKGCRRSCDVIGEIRA